MTICFYTSASNTNLSDFQVCAGDRGHAEALPLIVREHLPLCAHTTIVEQMVAGNIGSEEEIHRFVIKIFLNGFTKRHLVPLNTMNTII